MRKYDPTPPPVEGVDLSKFPLKLAQIKENPLKKGWERYEITLPNEARALHLEDAIHGQQWKALVLEFDNKPMA